MAKTKSNGVTQKELYLALGEHREQVFAKIDSIKDEIHQINLCFTGEVQKLSQMDLDQNRRLDIHRKEMDDITKLQHDDNVGRMQDINSINSRDRWLTGTTVVISAGVATVVAWLEKHFGG